MASGTTLKEDASASCVAVLAHHLLNSMTPVAGTLDALRHHRHHFDEEAIAISLRVAARQSALVVETLRALAATGPEEALVVISACLGADSGSPAGSERD